MPFHLGIFILQVFLLASATNVFAFTPSDLDLKSSQGEFFKADQNKQAVLFEENISEGSYQIASETDTDPVNFNSCLKLDHGLSIHYFQEQNSLKFQPNYRQILKAQIYPFHSFW